VAWAFYCCLMSQYASLCEIETVGSSAEERNMKTGILICNLFRKLRLTNWISSTAIYRKPGKARVAHHNSKL
jgi:hypothetical protein